MLKATNIHAVPAWKGVQADSLTASFSLSLLRSNFQTDKQSLVLFFKEKYVPFEVLTN